MANSVYMGGFMRSLVLSYPGPTAALRAWRAAGGKIRTQDFYRAYGEAKAQLALAQSEVGADLQAVPEESQIAQGTFPRARGIAHEVVIVGRARSGEILTKRVEVPTGQTPIQRLQAIERAEEWARGFLSSEAPKRTDLVTVYGGIHVGVIRRNPE
jgi:hypothetical protein